MCSHSSEYETSQQSGWVSRVRRNARAKIHAFLTRLTGEAVALRVDSDLEVHECNFISEAVAGPFQRAPSIQAFQKRGPNFGIVAEPHSDTVVDKASAKKELFFLLS